MAKDREEKKEVLILDIELLSKEYVGKDKHATFKSWYYEDYYKETDTHVNYVDTYAMVVSHGRGYESFCMRRNFPEPINEEFRDMIAADQQKKVSKLMLDQYPDLMEFEQ